jgi:hypothetical protein
MRRLQAAFLFANREIDCQSNHDGNAALQTHHPISHFYPARQVKIWAHDAISSAAKRFFCLAK